MFSSDRAWKTWNTRYSDQEAFTSEDGTGYRSGRIFDKTYQAHRVIWFMLHGRWPNEIDHDNGHRSDNREFNILDAGRAANTKNKCISSRNTSGVNGVYWDKRREKWIAAIQVGGRAKFLGYRSTVAEAAALRRSADRENGFHPNHGRRPA
jgi:hypothetical protein